jgi:hypothetical protein
MVSALSFQPSAFSTHLSAFTPSRPTESPAHPIYLKADRWQLFFNALVFADR